MRFSFAVVSALVLSSLVGCAASATTEDADASSDAFTASASTACSAKAYNDGLAHYKKAVAAAKQNLAKDICNDDGADGSSGMISTISGESNAAVKSCGAFQKVIETSIYAKPIRDTLAANLALPYLTGKLVTAGSFAGLTEALAGKTMWGPAPGAYGNMSKIVFAADGKATVSKLDTSGDKAIWTDSAATWSTSTGVVSVTVDGQATHYTVSLEDQDGVLDFVFKNQQDDADRFDSLPSECEA